MSLAVSDLSLCFIPVSTPILLIQLLDGSDLHPETPNLFSKYF
jgi:hypothetical protein